MFDSDFVFVFDSDMVNYIQKNKRSGVIHNTEILYGLSHGQFSGVFIHGFSHFATGRLSP